MRGIRDSGHARAGMYVFLVLLVSGADLAAAAGLSVRVAQHSESATYRQRGDKALKDGNEAEAVRWYQRAADLGDPDAQVSLGSIYELSGGNAREAARWYAKAALQGHAVGEAFLGHLYIKGKGVPRDYREAFRWLQKAAAQHQSHAEYNLGYLYEFGLGVPRSPRLAAGWYERAAAQGHPGAGEAAHHLRIPGSVSFRTVEERDRYLFNMLGEHLRTIRETSDRLKADCERRQRTGEPWLSC